MQASFWVKIQVQKKYGGWIKRSVACFATKPGTKKDEVAIKVSIDIPDAYFETPELSANIVIPADSVNKPVITPSVQHNIVEELKKQLGMNVHLCAMDDTPEPETKTKGKKK